MVIGHARFGGMKQVILFAIASVRVLSSAAPSADSAKHWVGTWSTAPYLVEPANMPPSPGLTDNTLRQVVRVSISGDTVRVKFSNVHNVTAVAMKAVNIAVSKASILLRGHPPIDGEAYRANGRTIPSLIAH
jgi:hypothetical protein